MDLCFPYRTIGKPNPRKPLALSPPSWAMHLPQTGQFANRTARRERFRAGNLTADLEEHSVGILSFARAGTRRMSPRQESRCGDGLLEGWLGRRDSNPDTQIQSLQSYR